MGLFRRDRAGLPVPPANERLLYWSKFPNDKARIRLYFDDEPKPRIDMTFAQFFGKDGKYTAPFTPPLAYFDVQGSQTGSWQEEAQSRMYANLYYPFPFQKRLKITASVEGGMQPFACSWYQYTYLKYPAGTAVKTWTGAQVDSPLVRRLWQNMGQDPKPAASTPRRSSKPPRFPGAARPCSWTCPAAAAWQASA